MAKSFYTSNNGVMFVSPGGQSEQGAQVRQAGYVWAAVNIADGHGWNDWQTSIRQFQAAGMRTPVWGRVQNMPLEAIMGVAIQNHVPCILNIEDEFKTTSPAEFQRRILAVKKAHPTYTREIVISTVGWVYNDVDFRPLRYRPVLLQIFPADMHFDSSELPVKTDQCVYHAKQNIKMISGKPVNYTGFRDVGVTFQTYSNATPDWYDYWGIKPRSLFHGDSVGAQQAWSKWAVA